MIDDKLLQQFESDLKADVASDERGYETVVKMYGDVGIELVRLARLGLWARDHVIPAMEGLAAFKAGSK